MATPPAAESRLPEPGYGRRRGGSDRRGPGGQRGARICGDCLVRLRGNGDESAMAEEQARHV
jgi:hypothetical protein